MPAFADLRGAVDEYGWFTIYICVLVSFGGFLFGYDTSNISGIVAMPEWLATFGHRSAADAACGSKAIYNGETWCLSSVNKSLITSLLSIGTCGGALSGALVAEYAGRKGGIIFAASVFTIGVTVQTGVTNVGGLIVGRILAGYGVGLISMCIPMYQAEAAPPRIRGALVSFYQFAITCGILLAEGVDLGTENRKDSGSWRIPQGLQILWGLLIIIGVLFVPESPRFLIQRGKIEEGRVALARMRSKAVDADVITHEMEQIQGNLEYEKSLGTSTYRELFQGHMLNRTMCGILNSPYLITVATGVVNVGMTIPGIYMVERLGRRKFLLGGALWMSFCQLIVGAVAVGKKGSDTANNVLVAFTLLFIAGFASTWGPAMSLATFSNWFWNWVIAFCVPYITDAEYGNLGSKIAFIWFATSLVGAVWVPETRFHSLEELDEMFEAGLKPWQTAGWKPTGASLHAAHESEKVAPKEVEHEKEVEATSAA
ncbi:hypothetical protein RQP46_005369 [Phenoliferia psychrophenolica]